MLSWRDLRAELAGKDGNRTLLDGACGDATPGRVLAVIGPSGAGKTTLIQMLAGRLEYSKHVRVSGTLDPLPSATAPASFVYQDDAFHSRLTVQEVLRFAAAMRLSPDVAAARAAEILQAMGLQDVASSVVGGGKVRGISGGERKRLAIGCELCVTEASTAGLFADEPTSGLDSSQALRIVHALSSVASAGAGRVAVLTMHQPSARLLSAIQDVLLLGAGGQTLYLGPVDGMLGSLEHSLECAPSAGAASGTPLPLFAPAEWALELASVEPSSEEASKARIRTIAREWRASVGRRNNGRLDSLVRPPGAPALEAAVLRRAPATVQLRWCLWRAWRQATASASLLGMRAFSTACTGAVFGIIFWQLPPRAIKARVGVLQVLANYSGMTAALRSVCARGARSPLIHTCASHSHLRPSFTPAPLIHTCAPHSHLRLLFTPLPLIHRCACSRTARPPSSTASAPRPPSNSSPTLWARLRPKCPSISSCRCCSLPSRTRWRCSRALSPRRVVTDCH